MTGNAFYTVKTLCSAIGCVGIGTSAYGNRDYPGNGGNRLKATHSLYKPVAGKRAVCFTGR